MVSKRVEGVGGGEMKLNRYEVKCGACGFEYVMFSSDTSEEFMEELKDCPCGNEADIEMLEAQNDD